MRGKLVLWLLGPVDETVTEPPPPSTVEVSVDKQTADSSTEPLPSLTEEERGKRLATLVLNSQLWIHRRVERLVIEPTGECMRYVSLDFTLDAKDAVPASRERVLVPIGFMLKGPLHCFSLTGPSGKPVPLLGAADNCRRAAEMVVSIAKPWGASDEVLETLCAKAQRVISAPMKDDTGYEIPNPEPNNDTQGNNDLPPILTHEDRTKAREEFDRAAEAAGLPLNDVASSGGPTIRAPFLGLVDQLMDGFLMLVELDASIVGRRSIIKFEYRERPRNPDKWTGSRRFNVSDFALARSSHFELTPPPLLQVKDAKLVEIAPRPSNREIKLKARSARSTLHLFGAPRWQMSKAYVRVKLTPRLFGAYSAALWGPLAVFLALSSGLMMRGYRNELDSPIAPISAGLPTLVLTAGGLLLTWVARAPEDWTTARILRTARLVLISAAVLCALIVTYLAVPLSNPPEPARTYGWWTLLSLSTALLIWAWFVTGRRFGFWTLLAFLPLTGDVLLAPSWYQDRCGLLIAVLTGAVIWSVVVGKYGRGDDGHT